MERRKMLYLLDARIELTPAARGMPGAISKAEEIIQAQPDAVMLQQFSNPANPEIHRQTTAEEIWRDTNGKVDVLIAGVGTGGTMTGVAKALKSRKPDVRTIAIEPEDSPVISGGVPGPHKIQGIGAGFVPKVLNTQLIDEIIKIDDNEAFYYGRLLARLEGLLSGISSGAALAATIKIGQREELINQRLIVILPSFGERYLSTAMFESNTVIKARQDGYL